MGQWSLTERLQPSLLDRLTDERPDRQKESSSDQFLSQQDLKAAVIRDLSALFNCVNLETVMDLEPWEEVRHSVLNYGVPELAGHMSSAVDIRALENAVKRAILEFEPRLIRRSLRLSIRADEESMSHNSLVFEIEGAIFGQPAPFQVSLLSNLDLENGNFAVRES